MIHPGGPVRTITLGEYNTDPDEMLAAFLIASLTRQGFVDPLAFVGNHADALKRAQSIKFVLNLLGLGHIPVGMGEHGFGASSTEFEDDPRFLAPATQVGHGREVLRWTLQHAPDESVALVLNSSFTDVVWLWLDDPQLFMRKVCRVIIMGAVEVDGEQPRLSSEGFLLPSIGRGGAANNVFDPGAAQHLYDLVQRYGIPSITTTRHAAGACQLPFGVYGTLAATGNPAAIRLSDKQKSAIRGLWQRANEPEGTVLRGKLPARCDRTWFVNFFCGGDDPGIGAGNGPDTQDGNPDDIVPHIKRVAAYDVINSIAAVPTLLDRFFAPHWVEVNGTQHGVVGLTPAQHGIAQEDELRRFITVGMLNALTLGNMPFANPAMAAS